METFWLYLIKMIVCSAVMLGYYQIFLRDKTFHHYNRFYLLSILVISICLPLLKISDFTIDVSENLYIFLTATPVAISRISEGDLTSWKLIVSIIITLFSAFLLLKMLLGIAKIYSYKRKFTVHQLEGVNFFHTNLEAAPFSFFRNLFWKDSIDVHSDLGRQILKHEMVHIEQKHSWDKIFAEAITAIFWFNPIFYFVKKELYLIHEYLADHNSVKNNDLQSFAKMIMETHFTGNSVAVASPFLNSNLKKRLKMLQRSKTQYSYLRKLLILPVLFFVGFAYLLNARNKEIEAFNKKIDATMQNQFSGKSDTIRKENMSIDVVESTGFNFNEKLKNASDKALYIVNSERVSKKEFLRYITANKNLVQSYLGPEMNDDNLLVFGEIQKKFGVFQADDKDKMEENMKKYHELIKEINAKWYYTQILPNKYENLDDDVQDGTGDIMKNMLAQARTGDSYKIDDRFVERSEFLDFYTKNKNNSEFLAMVAMLKHDETKGRLFSITHRDNLKKSRELLLQKIKDKRDGGSVDKNVSLKRDYDKDPLTQQEIVDLRKQAEEMRIAAEKKQEEKLKDYTTVIVKAEKVHRIVLDNDDRILSNTSNDNMVLGITMNKKSKVFINGLETDKSGLLQIQTPMENLTEGMLPNIRSVTFISKKSNKNNKLSLQRTDILTKQF